MTFRSQDRALRSRLRILEAATALFAKRGFDATAVRDVAFEAELSATQAEVARLQAEVAVAGNASVTTSPALEGTGAATGGDGRAEAAAIRVRAQEVYEGINESLSELRTMLITASGLFSEVGPMVSDEDARKALGDALTGSKERAEDAKGVLRKLRELVQS